MSRSNTSLRKIALGHYQGTYPFVNQSGYSYASQWKHQVIQSVIQGTTVWEVESSSSEEVAVTLERPKAKPRPSPKSRASTDNPASSVVSSDRPLNPYIDLSDRPVNSNASSSSSALPKAKPASSSTVLPKANPIRAVAKAKERTLKPRQYLPDTVVWYDRGNRVSDSGLIPESVGETFKEVQNYSSYKGYKSYVSATSQSQGFPKFILFLDWHQVLDRSKTEGSWNDKFPRESLEFLRRVKDKAVELWGHREALQVVIVSHIEHSSKNLDHLLKTCNTYQQLKDDITQCLSPGSALELQAKNRQSDLTAKNTRSRVGWSTTTVK